MTQHDPNDPMLAVLTRSFPPGTEASTVLMQVVRDTYTVAAMVVRQIGRGQPTEVARQAVEEAAEALDRLGRGAPAPPNPHP